MTSYEVTSLIVQAVTGVAISATFAIYYFQLRTMQEQLASTRDASVAQNILAVVNFLQAEDVRAARTVVRQDLRSIPMPEWSTKQREAASRVCAAYDVAAVLLREGLVPLRPFTDNWGPSIKDCYHILLPFIESMQSPQNSGSRYWNDFGWLYEQVVKAHAGEAKFKR